MRYAVVIGGGSCPGIAPLAYYLGRRAVDLGDQLYFFQGWGAVVQDKPQLLPPNPRMIEQSGSPIGTSRYKPSLEDLPKIFETLATYDGLIGVGGNDTLGLLTQLGMFAKTKIGIPKTLDNDLEGTDFSVGHWSVVDRVVAAILRARSSTMDHGRFLVVETIGQDVGWVALRSGIACGANFIVIPEFRVELGQIVAAVRDHPTGLIVLTSSAEISGIETAEATMTKGDGFQNPHYEDRRIGNLLAEHLSAALGFDARCEVLTDSVRGGRACAYDLVLANQMANEAISCLRRRIPLQSFMIGVCSGQTVVSELTDAGISRKFVPQEMYRFA